MESLKMGADNSTKIDCELDCAERKKVRNKPILFNSRYDPSVIGMEDQSSTEVN